MNKFNIFFIITFIYGNLLSLIVLITNRPFILAILGFIICFISGVAYVYNTK